MQAADLLGRLDELPTEHKLRIAKALKALTDISKKEAARDEFLPFVKNVWPDFLEA